MKEIFGDLCRTLRGAVRRVGVNVSELVAAAPLARVVEPAILYVGTPVVLVSTTNPDGTANLAPMSSAWWLGWSCMLGLDASSQTVSNLRRNGECVLNLPEGAQAANVDALARTTGSPLVPPHKQAMGYEQVADKFGRAGLTAIPADTVEPPRAAECPIQLEGRVVAIHGFADSDHRLRVPVVAVEVQIFRIHAHTAVLSREFRNRIDPARWNPLLMSFLQYFGVGPIDQTSRLRDVNEELYGGRQPEPLPPTEI
jgi:flavin reductase (DIM6/NTAB) family NADH-FMN oxidoreductase RutF